jgi:uncharacterized protein DUF6092
LGQKGREMGESGRPETGVLTEEQALELIAFLASSAEISLTEPTHYANFRLIDATSRLIGFMLEHETPRTGAFLRAFKEEVDKKKVWMMWDEEAFFAFLRSAPALVAAEAKRLAEENAAAGKESA